MKPYHLYSALMLLGLGACATTPNPPIERRLADMGYAMGAVVDEIADYSVQGHRGIDDQYLVLRAGGPQEYLIELTHPCNGLQSAFGIGFTTTGSKLTKFDRLIVPGERTFPDCPIRQIRLLEPLDEQKPATAM